MPPRYSYWTIILEGAPTAFRARDANELIPTLRQLQAKHPDAVMRWFARGRLWNSPADAERERRASRAAAQGGRRTRPPDARSENWRPGGEHRDPKAREKPPRDVRRARFKSRLLRDRAEGDAANRRHDGPPRDGRAPFERRDGRTPLEPGNRKPAGRGRDDRWRSDGPGAQRGGASSKPGFPAKGHGRGRGPHEDWRGRGPSKPAAARNRPGNAGGPFGERRGPGATAAPKRNPRGPASPARDRRGGGRDRGGQGGRGGKGGGGGRG